MLEESPIRCVAGPAVTVATADQRRAAGLHHWIDGTMGFHRTGHGTIVLAPNGPTSARHDLSRGGFLGGLDVAPLRIEGLPPDVAHASGGPLLHDPSSGLLLMMYHGEIFPTGDAADFYSFLGMAVSSDLGRTFQDLGPAVTSDLSLHNPSRPRPVEMGSGGFVVRDGWMLVYFHDRHADGVRLDLGVARARVSDVLSAARSRRRPAFQKYAGGRFDAPGLGGPADELLPGVRHRVSWLDVASLEQLGRVLLVYSTITEVREGRALWNVAWSTSVDGIRWTQPLLLFERSTSDEALYLTIDPGGRRQRAIEGDRFDLYRVRASTPYRWDDARLERQPVTVVVQQRPSTMRSCDGVAAMSSAGSSELTLRRSAESDREAIIELCRASLGWEADDPNEEFFSWKHDENPFGRSPSWVAVAPDGTIAGLRVFLRWRFREPSGTTFTAVRAVDTATHPDWQGKGIFTKLTLGAIPDLRAAGVDVIFNTPNDKSRPGYLKMGWSQVGRVPVGIRPTSPRSAMVIAKARTAAELWSTPSDVGVAAAEAFADEDAVARLLDACPPLAGIATDRDAAYLRWRYSFSPLRYRAVLVADRLEDGVVVVRLRRRGPALECAVVDVLVPGARSLRATFAHLARASGADYLLRCIGRGGLREGFLPAPQLGPILTWRPICRTGVPSANDLSLSLGDVELF